MQDITLGQVGLGITFLVGLITGIGVIDRNLKTYISESLKVQFKDISDKIDGLQTRIDDVDMESCKNFLVSFLSDLEKGEEIDEIEKERFWEQYQHYTKSGGNSYIKRKVEKLTKEGKL